MGCSLWRHCLLKAVTVDNGRHGQDDTVAVVDDGVGWLVLDDVQVVSQVTVCLQPVQNQTSPLKTNKFLQPPQCCCKHHFTYCLPCTAPWAGWQCTLWSGWGAWSRCRQGAWPCRWTVLRWCPGHGCRWPPGSFSWKKIRVRVQTMNS